MMDFNIAHHDQVSEYGTPSSSIPDSPLPMTPDSTRTKHDRKRPKSHIPRPPNAFLLFRSDFLKRRVIPTNIEVKQHHISRIAGNCWKRMTLAEQQVWNDLAREKEEQHAKMYPDYQYRPVKRPPVQKRRQTITKEEDIEYCTFLMAAFVPGNTEPILRDRKSVRRIRKSRAKPRVAKNVVQSRTAPQAPPTDNSVVFAEPLRPPFHHSTAEESFPTTNGIALDPALEPPLVYDVPPAFGNFEVEDKWFSQIMQTPAPAEQDILSAVAHMQAQFDVITQDVAFPMGPFYPQGVQAFSTPESFFIPIGTSKHVLNSPSYSAPMTAGQESPFTTHNQLFPPTPPAYFSNAAFLFPDLGSEDFRIPQGLPITLPAPEPTSLETPLPLVPSVSDGLPNSLDNVTFSFDESSLSNLSVDVNGQYTLFGENPEAFVVHSEASLTNDIFHINICSS